MYQYTEQKNLNHYPPNTQIKYNNYLVNTQRRQKHGLLVSGELGYVISPRSAEF